MTLYSYIVTYDTGFAPNPFFGYCTLVCCKPAIRRSASVGDWIIGLTPKAQGNRVVYFMRVDEKMTIAEYWKDKRFRQKRPQSRGDARRQCGDNIYEPLATGGFRQLPSFHSNGEAEDERIKKQDVGGMNALISETFAYYGAKAIPLPSALSPLVAGRHHKSRFSTELLSAFHRFAAKRLGSGTRGVVKTNRLRWGESEYHCLPISSPGPCINTRF